MKSTIISSLVLLVFLSSCQKETVELKEPAPTSQAVSVNKIVYLDYFLQEVSMGDKQKLVITTTLNEATPKEIQVNYVVFMNGVLTQVKVVVPAGLTKYTFETSPYVSTVPFEIVDIFVTYQSAGWTIRYAKP